MKIAIIHWIDAGYDNYQYDEETAKTCVLCDIFSTGILIVEYEDRIIIAQDIFPAKCRDDYRHIAIIPRVCIKNIKIYEYFEEKE